MRCLLDCDGDSLSTEVCRLREDAGDCCLSGRRPDETSCADLCGGLLLERRLCLPAGELARR